MTDTRFNATVREKLAQEWRGDVNDDLDQHALRSRRAQQGIKCAICGKVGYYRENCPNYCISPPPTPDSWDDTPPGTPRGGNRGGNQRQKEVEWKEEEEEEESEAISTAKENLIDDDHDVGFGILWGPQKTPKEVKLTPEKRKSKVSLINTKADLSDLRPIANAEVKRLRDADARVVQQQLEMYDEKMGGSSMYEFLTVGKEGYDRNYSELNLHQVMRRIMRMVEQEVLKNATKLENSFDVTLLHPPNKKPQADFFPKELWEKDKEFRDYAIMKDSKKKSW